MSDFTNDELALLVAAIDAYCCGHLNQITRSYQAVSLDYVLSGGGSKQYAKTIELRAKVLAELELRKGAT